MAGGPKMYRYPILALSLAACALAIHQTCTPTPILAAEQEPTPLRTLGYVDVKAFGAAGDGSTDDTAAINSAIRYARGLTIPPGNVGNTNTPYYARLYFPQGNYLISDTLDFTHFSDPNALAGGNNGYAFEVEGYGAYISTGPHFATEHPIIDALGSRTIKFVGFTLAGNGDGTSGSHEPNVGIQIGRVVPELGADFFTFRDVSVIGNFSLAAFYSLASEVTQYDHVLAINNDRRSGSYSLILDGANHFSITSKFVEETIPRDTHQSFTLNGFHDSQFLSGPNVVGRGTPIWLSDTEGVKFDNVYANTNAATCVVLFSQSEVNPLSALQFDNFHCEGQNIRQTFLVSGENLAPVIRRFHYGEIANFSHGSVLGLANTNAHGILQDSEIQIDRYVFRGSKVFDDPERWAFTGSYFAPSAEEWNIPASFSGHVTLGNTTQFIGRGAQ